MKKTSIVSALLVLWGCAAVEGEPTKLTVDKQCAITIVQTDLLDSDGKSGVCALDCARSNRISWGLPIFEEPAIEPFRCTHSSFSPMPIMWTSCLYIEETDSCEWWSKYHEDWWPIDAYLTD